MKTSAVTLLAIIAAAAGDVLDSSFLPITNDYERMVARKRYDIIRGIGLS